MPEPSKRSIRFSVLVCVLLLTLGTLYGYFGALANSNPGYPDGVYNLARARMPAMSWRPSAAWITSYALCEAEIGMCRSRSGYFFLSYTDRARYVEYSTALGFLLGLAAATLFFGRRVLQAIRQGKYRSYFQIHLSTVLLLIVVAGAFLGPFVLTARDVSRVHWNGATHLLDDNDFLFALAGTLIGIPILAIVCEYFIRRHERGRN